MRRKRVIRGRRKGVRWPVLLAVGAVIVGLGAAAFVTRESWLPRAGSGAATSPTPTALASQSATATATSTPVASGTATPASLSTGTAPQQDSSPQQAEALLLERINALRQERDMKPLQGHAGLTEVARAHSQDMAERNYFNSTSPDGQGPEDRVKQAGLEGFRCGESIFRLDKLPNTQSEAIAQSTLDGWKADPDALRNLTDTRPNTGAAGIFIVERVDPGSLKVSHTVYVTYLFCIAR